MLPMNVVQAIERPRPAEASRALASLYASVLQLVQELRSPIVDCAKVLRLSNRIAAQAFSAELKAVATRLQAAAIDPNAGGYEHRVRTATHILLLMLEEMQQRP
jgi:hypothetical protein